jgi:hypothetical protein
MKKAILAALLLLPMTALAAPETDACASLRKRDPKARCKNVSIETDIYEGTLAMPLNEWMKGRPAREHGSLIKERADFIDKIVASAADI